MAQKLAIIAMMQTNMKKKIKTIFNQQTTNNDTSNTYPPAMDPSPDFHNCIMY
jgi:hypothetical protein